MAGKKPSRAAKRCKTVDKINCNGTDHNENSKTSLDKRLDDFDRQVAARIKQMEADKESCLDFIRSLYYMDKQRTPSHINNMLWVDYEQQQNSEKSSCIRNSIDNLINTAEAKTRGKKNPIPEFKEVPVDGIRRSTRKRTNNILEESQIDNITRTATKTNMRGRKKDMTTPIHQNIQLKDMITPKFNMRTPLPAGSARKARPGELMVSLKGSPIISSKVGDVINKCDLSTLDEESMGALQLLKRKLGLTQ